MGACGSTEKLQKKPARSLSGLRAPAEEPEPIEKPPDFVLRLAHPETPFELSCDPDSRVEELLRQVAVRLGCPAEQFELFSIVFSDIQLEPSSRLSEAGVCEGAECTLITEAWEAWESAQAEREPRDETFSCTGDSELSDDDPSELRQRTRAQLTGEAAEASLNASEGFSVDELDRWFVLWEPAPAEDPPTKLMPFVGGYIPAIPAPAQSRVVRAPEETSSTVLCWESSVGTFVHGGASLQEDFEI
eukprot:TRINITY_DN5487_c0_g1_i6.p1 TRINITY_DN5487_c0_g1~~TRINITY_DN5487_c0_g1_i6.p1  ORF type:complete len:246 (-),score=49.60 TRINITY_DN5487_c0_g1_i6:210-947(-)